MTKPEVTEMKKLALEELSVDSQIPLRLLQIIIDTTKWKLYKYTSSDIKKKKIIKFPFLIRYTNHWIDKLKLHQILHNKILKDTLPKCIYEQEMPTIVYKLKPTIRGKIFNYKETVSSYMEDQEKTMS